MIYFLPVCSFLYYKARIIKSQFYKFRLTVFKDSIICKTAVGKNICRFIKCIGDLVRTMCIGTDRDDLPTKLSVASDDCTAGVRLAKPVMEPSGVQLDSAALGNDRPQDLIKNVLIASVRVFAVLLGPYRTT